MINYLNKTLKYLLPALILSSAIISCAKIGSLSGGPKDMQPPRIDTALSDRNFQVRYYPESIVLHFDEWIELKNKSQILISPPLEFNPTIEAKGKKIEVVFDEEEVLRDSTTYAINFGDAIVDFTESNPVKNYRFVFATGDKIDSLSLRIMVKDAYSGEPVDDVTVLLYDEYRDSIVYTDKPYYFAKTDKSGACQIQNMRSGKFKCFALKDADFNFLYNQETEEIGFPDSLVHVRADSMVKGIVIELFLPTPEIQLTETDIKKKGKLKLLANRIVDDIELIETNVEILEHELAYDSVFYWFRTDSNIIDSVFMVLKLNQRETLDTITVKSKRNISMPGEVKFASFKGKKVSLKPGQALGLKFNQVIESLDTAFFELMLEPGKPILDTIDSLTIDTIIPPPVYLPYSVMIDSSNSRQIQIDADFLEGGKYILNLFPGAIKGYFDNSNDTLTTNITVELLENLGNIYCTFDSLDAEKQYVVFLKQKTIIIDKQIISKLENSRLEFVLIPPGNYSLEIIVDENGNGRWDPGSYLEKRQAENKLDVNLEELKKNWDLETVIKWDGR